MEIKRIFGSNEYKVVDDKGSWMFVGTKPECELYVQMYKPKHKAVPTEVYNS